MHQRSATARQAAAQPASRRPASAAQRPITCRRPKLSRQLLPKASLLGIEGLETAQDLAGLPATFEGKHPQRQQALQCLVTFLAAHHPDADWQRATQDAQQQLLCLRGNDGPAAATTTPQQLLRASLLSQQLEQLQAYETQLEELQTGVAAAVAGLQQQPLLSPVLQVDAAAAAQHPVWVQEYEATGTWAPSQQQTSSRQQLPFTLPEQAELQLPGGLAALHPAFWYQQAAAAAAAEEWALAADASSSGPVLAWPLTAAATKLLVGSPLGTLPDTLLSQVFALGVSGRCRALCEAADLARTVAGEQQQVAEQLAQLRGQQQLGPATAQDLVCPHVQPNAVAHPAVAASFLTDLATFGKHAAADELQGWLDACRQDPALRAYLSQAQQQLPRNVSSLQPFQVEGLRQLVALAAANGTQRRKAVSAGSERDWATTGGNSQQDWLQDYVHLPQLLPRVCEVLGGCLGLRIQHSPAAAGTWCDEAHMLTVFDDEAPAAASSSRSSRHGGKAAETETSPPPLGSVWLLLDASHDGLPVTHLVSPGGLAPAAAAGGAASQAVVVAIVLPRSFCSSIRLGSSSGGGSEGASAASVLRGVLHELGHSLHYLLSTATAGGATGLRDAGPWASLELCEVAAHLTERLTRDATCLQALLRHRDTQQAPPPALIQQLLAYERVSNRGVQQWQQHVIAALLDATMAAGSGEQPGEGGTVSSCWRRLQELQAQHDPLPGSCQGSVALLEYLPALAVMQPGDRYCYVFADLLAAALWATFLTPDPFNPEAWQQLRRGLFEAKASEGTAAVVERLCGPGSMRSLSVRDERTGEVVTGRVPDLTAQAFVDIDLWS